MGVDFFPCDRCRNTICDCGDYIRCKGKRCDRVWCCFDCAKEDGYLFDSDHDDYGTCSFCRKEQATESELLHHALDLLKMTRAKLLKSWINENK